MMQKERKKKEKSCSFIVDVYLKRQEKWPVYTWKIALVSVAYVLEPRGRGEHRVAYFWYQSYIYYTGGGEHQSLIFYTSHKRRKSITDFWYQSHMYSR
jgi:hypothetical protein